MLSVNVAGYVASNITYVHTDTSPSTGRQLTFAVFKDVRNVISSTPIAAACVKTSRSLFLLKLCELYTTKVCVSQNIQHYAMMGGGGGMSIFKYSPRKWPMSHTKKLFLSNFRVMAKSIL